MSTYTSAVGSLVRRTVKTASPPSSVTVELIAETMKPGDSSSMFVTGTSADVPVTNIDDESPGFMVSAISSTVTEEGGEAVFTVRLTSEPTADVYVDISSGEISEATVSPGLLTFDSSNWRSEQTVLVTGQDDNVSDGNQAFSIVLSDNSSSASEYLV